MNKQKALDYLNENNIQYELFEHKAVFTCDEAKIHCSMVPGLALKNLLLKSDKGKFFLVVLPAEKKLNMKELRKKLEGVKKLRFASKEELMDLMNLEPGSVTPIGLINDKEKKIKLFLDLEVSDAKIVNFHPNVNTASVAFTNLEFKKFLKTLNHEYEVLEV